MLVDPPPFEYDGIYQQPVPLSEEEVDSFYFGFCNGTLWPLYHDAIVAPEYHRHTTGPEILRDFAGRRLDYWVTGYGSGVTRSGAG